MATDAFGLSDTPPEVTLGLVEPEEQEPTVEQAVEAEAPQEGTPSEAETQQEAPEAPEAEIQVEDTGEEQNVNPEPGESPEQAPEEDMFQVWLENMPEGVRFAGKYSSPVELEKGYNESREMWRRATESRKAEAEARFQAEQREAELANVLSEAMPYLRAAAEREQQFHRFAEQYRQQVGEYPQGYTGPPTPQAQKALAPDDVNRLVEQRLEAERQQMMFEIDRQREFQATSDAVMSFYSDHPEVEPRGIADNEITDTMQVLNEAWAPRGEEVDMSDRGTLEILYEASQRPALRQVLALRPELFDSETGLTLARSEASVIEGAPTVAETTTTRRVPASQVGSTSGQRKPFAESAVTGAEAQEQEDENDPWTQIKREHAKGKNTQSVFQFE